MAYFNLLNLFDPYQRKRGPEYWDEDISNIPARDETARAISPPVADERLINMRPSLDVPAGVEPQYAAPRPMLAPISPESRAVKEVVRPELLPPTGMDAKRAVEGPRVLAPPQPDVPTMPLSLAVPEAVPTAPMRALAEPIARAPMPEWWSGSESGYQYHKNQLSHPTEEQYTEAHRPKGFGKRLLSVFKTGGKVLLGTGLNPIAAGAGMVHSALDPDTEARFDYRTQIEPRYNARQKQLATDFARETEFRNDAEDRRLKQEAFDYTKEQNARRLDLDERDHALKVQDFIRRLQSEAAKAKTEEERERFNQAAKVFQFHLDTRTPAPAWVVDALNSPDLANAAKAVTERETPWSVRRGQAIAKILERLKKHPNDLVDNPDYEAAYNAAAEIARRNIRADGGDPNDAAAVEREIDMMIAAKDIRSLPPRQVQAYKTISDAEVEAEAARIEDEEQKKKSSRRQLAPPKGANAAAPGSKGRLTQEQVAATIKANKEANPKLTDQQIKDALKADGWILP